jgi:hypothetical protein
MCESNFQDKIEKKCTSILILTVISQFKIQEFSNNSFCFVQCHANYPIHQNCNGWEQYVESACQQNVSLSAHEKKKGHCPTTELFNTMTY